MQLVPVQRSVCPEFYFWSGFCGGLHSQSKGLRAKSYLRCSDWYCELSSADEAPQMIVHSRAPISTCKLSDRPPHSPILCI
ncbi:hypothetical protein P879_04995 [Paragonimus westermani]|uniref:Uncharacterized protein n=1 Tax=Paragonimus westermani TaxID=34504 RepID=A0A8T0DNJ0_9TREM|nr:hypothetical protein P879_04995 [Paragonimus westermani]